MIDSPAEAAMDRGDVGVGVTGGLVEVAVVIIRHLVRPANLSIVHLNSRFQLDRLAELTIDWSHDEIGLSLTGLRLWTWSLD